MPVTYLELENFKSYAGVQLIGPFRDFTSIIGPNGAGKSNLMDAMSFVLGVQSRDLRSSQLKDLIFRPPGASSKKLRARAALYYQPEEPDEPEICFSRAISPAGNGDYQVNGKTVSYAKYEEALAEIGVLVKARNFLVFQGDVESLAHKSPKELVELLEQISTSIDLKPEYDRLWKEKEQAEAATIFAYNKQKGFKSERRILKDQKEEAQRFEDLQKEMRQTQTDLYLWQLYHMNALLDEKQEHVDELERQVEALQESEQEAHSVLREAKKQASSSRRETAALDKKRVALATQLAQLEPSLIQVAEQVKQFTKKSASDEKQMQKLNKERDSHKETLKALDSDIVEYQGTLAQLEKDYQTLQQEASDVVLTQEQEAEYQRVRELAAAASDQPRRKLQKLQRQLESARSKAVDTDVQNLTKRQEETNRDVEALQEREATLKQVSD
jgi:structural maintenance of chromosome 1